MPERQGSICPKAYTTQHVCKDIQRNYIWSTNIKCLNTGTNIIILMAFILFWSGSVGQASDSQEMKMIMPEKTKTVQHDVRIIQ